jgi:phage protein D
VATPDTQSDSGIGSARLYGAQPVFTVDGDKQPSLTDSALSVEVSEDVRGMARLTASFENWGTPPGGGNPGFMYFDGGVLGFGRKLEVDLGPTDASRTVFSGYISAVGAQFGSHSIPEVTVLAEDALQFFRMTRRTRTYENVSDADVARTLAQQHNLQADADAAGPTHTVLVQLGQTDLAFLRERAAAIDAQVYIEEGKLKFKARGDRDGGQLTLTLGDTLNRFRVIADLAHQVTSVHAHGYDVGAKSDFDSEAAGSVLSGELKGAKSGFDLLQKAFGERVEHVVDRGLGSGAEARALAEATQKLRGRAFVRCRGETQGTAAMKVGSRLQIGGVGPMFSGTYFATSVMHRYDRVHGYLTVFEAERPAVGQEN